MQDTEKETDETDRALNVSYEYRKDTKKEEEKPKEKPAKMKGLRKEQSNNKLGKDKEGSEGKRKGNTVGTHKGT